VAKADRRLLEAKQRGRNTIAGPTPTGERRHHRRIALEIPVWMCSPDEGPAALWHEGRSRDLSLAGMLCTVPAWSPVAVGEMVRLSIPIPPDRQREFPFSRLAGRGRVVRIEELARRGASSQSAVELALAFGTDLIALAAVPGMDRENASRVLGEEYGLGGRQCT
jgi:hypothetical protein